MKHTSFLVLLVTVMLPLSLFGQETHRFYLDKGLKLVDEIWEPKGLYKLASDTIFCGVRDNTKFMQKQYLIKGYPKGIDKDKAAYKFILYQGWEKSSIPKHTLVLITDYETSPIVYVDMDFDLDFSEEKALTFDDNGLLEFKLPNSTYLDAGCLVKLKNKAEYPSEERKAPFIKHISNHAYYKGNVLLDPQYWWGQMRTNARTGKGLLGQDSVYLGVRDVSANGIFNDKGRFTDMIMIGDYSKNTISAKYQDGTLIPYTSEIPINGKSYAVRYIEPTGDYIELEKVGIAPIPIKQGDVIPNYQTTDFDDQEIGIHDKLATNGYTLLYFWGTWCKPCIEKMPRLLELDEQNNNLKVLAVNSHDKPGKGQAFLQKRNIDWDNVYFTEELLDKLYVKGFPRYILLDADKRIVLLNTNLDELTGFLTDQ